ncbi:MAG TPA: NFACT family protein [Pyrinomonadaceae bacterium]|nr:NFACT family protein [Pyrinomonadaceae bacterium]
MNDQTIKAIVVEIAPVLVGRMFGKVFELSRRSLAVDFRTHDGRYLFISVEPQEPAIYMIERRVRDLEKQSLPTSPFALVLRKHLGGATLASIKKDETDRIVRFTFNARDEIGNTRWRTLVAQLTGRTANLLLLDESGHIIDLLRHPRGEGQQVGELYQPPPTHNSVVQDEIPFERARFSTLSEAADHYYRALETTRIFDAQAAQARARLRKEISQREKLQRNLAADLKAHGDAAEHKRIGDLLLANLGSAERHGRIVKLRDYYADDAPMIEIEVDENKSLQEEAARRFSRYAKAKRAAQELKTRMLAIEKELSLLHARQVELEKIANDRDEAALESFFGEKKTTAQGRKAKQKSSENIPGARRYRSSDGYEILVGRAARDNDNLTFRVARPHDLWLHAADYPGSHVVVRNPNRAEIPHRTIIEAAQLAAAFSQAKGDAKVDVHYTQRKFLSKPKGVAPGLVRMSGFRTITVEPREAGERI